MRFRWPCELGWRGWLWPALLAALIVAASSQSRVTAPGIAGFDKVVHLAVFGLLATLVVRNGFAARHAWIAVVLVSLFGASDEWHQSYTPGRAAEFADWVADTLGAALAVAAYTLWPAYRAWIERGAKRRVENSPALPPNPPVP